MVNFGEYLDSPIGLIEVRCSDVALVSLKFVDSRLELTSNWVANKVLNQLDEYFKGERKVFDVPLELSGTDFQKAAWSILPNIPYGSTISYKQQAVLVGNPNASRAVGGANNKNKIPIIIPCHRVVGQNGALVGYAGGISRKEWLLKHERCFL